MINYKDLIKDSFKAVVEDLHYSQATVDQYFSKNYRQYVDGKELDYERFCRHMRIQKQSIKGISIDFKTIVQENHIVFTRHIVNITTVENRTAVIQVIAEFHIEDNKIQYCNELTHMISGDQRERDIGSRQ
ncbi:MULTISPECIES: hypothetical protein [Chryseobacterium]|uniref:Nuclear transport factor 2 family protein n=1 Tax=Chryseobacterium camelliae TaxID=1265445 RepID=A0ABU0TK47_9FLAO|nr:MULTISPECIES: hypothetical protein [Chryseobacterium]MDT3408972.1 hypothetical protein [Pseudacidovorax intermedius]MDQ1097171.1 hypothetical protein [Chryseobacterium camelliae]MDQ1101108.1 hypothetical protein [Chryseobacterium sp. SORGH_AS_1048]MDR6084551.1 hypothetical protein [Chryseobacterium sp. SORGH_AS_0909]MDR6132820.1 hypothetical protein [Chryseobacterium sp. SORGH_AS_1175]